MDMRMSVLATEVCASDRMKQVEDSDMHAATATPGAPSARHWVTIERRSTADRASARNAEANTLRHRFVVHGPVATRRAMRAPLLQHIAAHATNTAPRRVAATAVTVTDKRSVRAVLTSDLSAFS